VPAAGEAGRCGGARWMLGIEDAAPAWVPVLLAAAADGRPVAGDRLCACGRRRDVSASAWLLVATAAQHTLLGQLSLASLRGRLIEYQLRLG